jgi:hypothetical protein
MKAFQAFTLSICVGFLALGGATANTHSTKVCSMIYKPVCAVKNGHRKTYGNACLARAAHARVIYNGHCRFSH